MTDPMPGGDPSDDALSALADRRDVDATDPVLRAMGAWVARIDARPIAPLSVPVAAIARRQRTKHRRSLARWVVGLTTALTLSSTGFAAGVNGGPWEPLRYVTRQFYEFGQRDPGRLPDWAVRGGRFEDDRGAGDGESRSLDRPPLHRQGRAPALGGPRGRHGML
jgi:hypothetical protein